MKKTAPQGGALPAFIALLILGSVNHPNAQTLPPPWNHSDVGSPAAGGRASVSSGKFTVQGAGRIGGSSDEFHFVYQQISGDVDLRVRVDSLENVDPWARAGVMIRDGLGARVKHALVSVSAGQGIYFDRRRAAQADTRQTAVGTGTAPVWLRLARTGGDFAAYRSADGKSWTLVARETISMRSTVYVGLAVASDLPTRTATAVFSTVTLGASASLPTPWFTGTIGAATPGDATVSGDIYTVKGAGVGPAGTADQLQYALQAASGDVEVIAKLTTLGGTAAEAKAGITIRAGVGASSAHATMLGTVLSGWEFRRRLTAGEKTYRTAGPAGRAPGWIRVVREGDLFSGYFSPDGSNWLLVETDRITMPATVHVGFVVSGDGPSTLATATFGNVVIRRRSSTNDPPQVAILNPVSGASFSAGASITVLAAAADPDGVIAGVDFYRGSTLIGSDSTSPFNATWTQAIAGTHMLAAVARDADGASTVATAVVFVGSGTADKTATLLFVPSADHAKNVDSYTLSVYRAADPLSAPPLTKNNLGKPAPVDGEIAVDVSSIISALPAGAYKVVVTAIGDGGSTSSAPSAQFTK